MREKRTGRERKRLKRWFRFGRLIISESSDRFFILFDLIVISAGFK